MYLFKLKTSYSCNMTTISTLRMYTTENINKALGTNQINTPTIGRTNGTLKK
jgi:hypothetical protein